MDVDGYINHFENLHIRHEPQYQDINILLVGETGVGKSTFINSLANYICYENFDQAIGGELQILTPTLINLIDENNETFNIQVGSHDGKKQEVGAAGTTDVKSYLLPLPGGNLRLRLIDSPGMGDPDGVDQDDANIEKILNFLVNLEELHGVCFFMKSTTTRNNALFEYCIKQLMSRLELSASQNIIFVFTNTRSTFYAPGDTKPCLKKVIEEIKSKPPHVEIPFGDNIFCVDNEAFKFLAALKYKIKLSPLVKVNSRRSWVNSFEACKRLIYYIVGKGSKPPLRPHLMRNTIDVNRAKALIDSHSEPLAEVCELIDHNIRLLNQHKNDLKNDRKDLKELRTKLYIPNLTLEVVPLGDTTAVVCTSAKCATYCEINGVKQHVFNQVCQLKCKLRNELLYKFRNRGINILKHCRVMKDSICTECGCYFSKHVLTSNLKRTVSDKVVDETVAKEVDSKISLLERKQALINEIERKTQQHEDELNDIIESVAQFAHFLQINSISSFSDLFIEEITILIKREESYDDLANREKMYNLKKTLKKYEEAKLKYYENTKNFVSVGEAVRNIEATLDKLYKLEYSGKIIKDLFEKQKKARNWLFNINLDNNVLNEENSTSLKTVATTSKQTLTATWNQNVNVFGEKSKDINKSPAVAPAHKNFTRDNDKNHDISKYSDNWNRCIYPSLSPEGTGIQKVTCKKYLEQPNSTVAANSKEQKLAFSNSSTVANTTDYVENSNDLNRNNERGTSINVGKPPLTLIKSVESVTCQTDINSTVFNRYQEFLEASQKPVSDGFTQNDNYPPYQSYPKQSSQEFALERSQYGNYYGHAAKFTLPPEQQRPNPDFGAVSGFAATGGVATSDFPPGRSYYDSPSAQDTYHTTTNLRPPPMTRNIPGTNVRCDGINEDYYPSPSQEQFYNRAEPYHDQRYHSSSEPYNRPYQGRANDAVYSEHQEHYLRNRNQHDRISQPGSNNYHSSSSTYGQTWDRNDRIPQYGQNFLPPRY